MNNFKFFNPVEIIYGRGETGKVQQLCRGDKAFIITDSIICQMPFFKKLESELGKSFVGCYSKVQPNPECSDANEAAELARECNANQIIGIGGGSSMDTAKIVAVSALERTDVLEYLSGSSLPQKRLPLLLLPTTSGTGSEVTNVSVMSGRLNDSGKHIKKPIAGPCMYADTAIVDPDLTDTMPARLTAITGFDVYCHAIEAYWAISSNPFSDTLAIEAISLIMRNLLTACRKPEDREARSKMSLASLMAGIAFSQTRTTVLHGNSYCLTEKYKIDHGVACAILLAPFIKKNMEVKAEKLNRLAGWCGFADGYELADRTLTLYEDCGMPSKLSAYGIHRNDLGFIAEEALKQTITLLNPVKVTKDMLVDMMSKVL